MERRTHTYIYIYIYIYIYKVKEFHYRPGQTQRVSGCWGSQVSWQSAHEGGKVVCHIHRPPLPPRKYSWWVNPKAIVRTEGLRQRKIPLKLSGIEPTTFRLLVQCLNQLRHRVPHALAYDTDILHYCNDANDESAKSKSGTVGRSKNKVLVAPGDFF